MSSRIRGSHRLNSKRSAVLLAAAAAASSLLGSVARADTTWTAPADGNWNVSGNWNGGVPTANSNVAFDAILFTGTNAVVTNITATNNVGPLTLNSITFNSSAGIFTIGGTNLLSIASGGSVSNLAARAQTIQSPLTFLGAGTINNVVGGTLTLNGNITTSSPLTFTGGGRVLLGGGANSINTPITVDGGWVYLGDVLNGNTVLNGSGTPFITLKNDGRFSMNRSLGGDGGNNGTNFTGDFTVESGSSARIDYMQRGHAFGAVHGDSTTELTLGVSFVRSRIRQDMSDFHGRVNIVSNGFPSGNNVDFRPYAEWMQSASGNIGWLHLGSASPSNGINLTGVAGQASGFQFIVPMFTSDAGATLGGDPGDIQAGATPEVLGNIEWVVGGTGLSGTFAGNIANNRHSMTKEGSGTWTWTGNNSFTTRTTNINGGTLEIGNGGTTGTIGNGTGAVNDNAILAINRSGVTNVSNPIGGSGSVYITGSGEVLLSNGGNSYSGATNIQSGTLTVTSIANAGVPSSIGAGDNAAANLVINGGALNHNGVNNSVTDHLFTIGASGGSIYSNGVGSVGFTNNGAIGLDGVGARTLTLSGSNAGNNSIAGSIGNNGGATSIVKTGSGKWILSGANTYTGNTTISGGVLAINGSMAPSSNVIATGGGQLSGTGSGNMLVTTSAGGGISPGNSVGTTTVGGLTVNAGSVFNLEFDTSLDINDTIVVANSGGLNLASVLNGKTTVGGGGFNLIDTSSGGGFQGIGTFKLVQYDGALGGSLSNLSADSILSDLGIFEPNFGTMTQGGHNFVTLAITLNTATPFIYTSLSSGTWGNGSSWTGGAAPSTGQVALLPALANAPLTITVDAGRSAGGIGFFSADAYNIAGPNTLTLNNNGSAATLTVQQGNHTISAPVALTSGGMAAVISAGTSLTMSGNISQTSAVPIIKRGAGVLALTGNNSGLTGGFQLNNGALQYSAANNLGTTANAIAFNGGTLRWATGNTNDVSANGASARTITFGANGGTFDTGSNNVTLTKGIGGFSEGRLTKSGSGILSFYNPSSPSTSVTNTFFGGFTLKQGVVVANSVKNFGAGDMTFDGGTLRINPRGGSAGSQIAGPQWDFSWYVPDESQPTVIAARTVTIGDGGAFIDMDPIDGQFNVIVDNPIGNDGNGRLTFNGSTGVGEYVLQFSNNVNNTFKGGLTVTNDTVSVFDDGNLGTAPTALVSDHIILNGGTLNAQDGFTVNANRGFAIGNTSTTGVGTLSVVAGETLTIPSIISNVGTGSGKIIKVGGGTLALSGENTFRGGLTVNAGIVGINNNQAAGLGTVTLTNGTGLNAANGVTMSNVLNFGGNNELVVDAGNGTFGGAWVGTNVQVGVTLDGGSNMTFGNNSTTGMFQNFTGSITAAGNRTNNATLRIAGSDDHRMDQVFVQLGSGQDTQTFPVPAQLITRDGGTQTLGAITGDAGAFLRGASSSTNETVWRLGTKTSMPNFTFNGAITDGTGGGLTSIIKDGTGVMTLSGDNTFSGTARVSSGVLALQHGTSNNVPNANIVVDPGASLDTNSLAGGRLVMANTQTLTVNGTLTGNVTAGAAGRTLGGIGTISGNSTVENGGVIAPGGAGNIGTLTSQFANLNSASLSIELGNSADQFKVLVGNMNTNITGTNTFTFGTAVPGAISPGTFAVLDYTGTALTDLTKFQLASTTLSGATLALANNTANTSVDVVVGNVNAWKNDANGNWGTGGNWLTGSVPSGANATANLGHGLAMTGPHTVSLDSNRTVGSLNFNNAQSFTVAGTGALTMDVTSGSANINVVQGSHTISANVNVNDALSVFVNTGSSLNMTGSFNPGANGVTKSGTGTATFNNVRGTGNLTVAAGRLNIVEKAGSPAANTAGTSKVTSLNISTGASLDLTNNSMIIDYAAGDLTNQLNAVRGHLQNGRLLTSLKDRNHAADAADPSHPRNLGYADGALVGFGSGSTFAGVTLADADNLLIKYTWSGDSNLDGKVDVTDLGNLALAWNQTGQVWRTGDFNYDGNVNVSDLYQLALNWQQGVTGPALGPDLNLLLASFGLPTAVPEPTSIGLLGLGLMGALGARRRRKA